MYNLFVSPSLFETIMIKLNITNEQVKINLNKKENVLFTNNNVGIYLK